MGNQTTVCKHRAVFSAGIDGWMLKIVVYTREKLLRTIHASNKGSIFKLPEGRANAEKKKGNRGQSMAGCSVG